MTVTEEIKSRLDIVDVISDYMPLRKSGSSYSGFCPFHSNTRTPAFAVFPNTQTWRCFGACAEGGDVFSFVMKKQGWDFKETLVHLADRAGVQLEEATPADKAQRAARDQMTDLLMAAADYYHQLLLYAPQAEGARKYVSERGFTDETIATYRLGFALDSWDSGRNHFNVQGYDDEYLVAAGLLTVNEEKNTSYDRFRNRLMIPISDVSGHVVGFGARTLDPDGLPKYLNSPQTAVFDKSRLLFGLDLVKRHIREARQVIIVEGYMDVMQAWQAGFRNVVAQMGTALTEAQLRSIKRYTKRFVIALDADAAGERATLRSLEVAREALDREADTRFDAPGLVRQEGRLQADIRVVSLPEGNDPDKIIRDDADLWLELVSQAKPVVTYVIDVATGGLDMNDPKAKTAAARQVLPLINDVQDPIEREHFRQLLARKLGVDERVLLKVTLPATRRQTPMSPDAELMDRPGIGAESDGLSTIIAGSSTDDLRQANFMRQCLSHPKIVGQVDEKLTNIQQPVVTDIDFIRPDDKMLWKYVSKRASQWPIVSLDELWDSLNDKFLRDRVDILLAMPEIQESDLNRLPDLLVLSVLDWRLERLKALFSEVKQLFDESQSGDPEMRELYGRQLRELPLQVLRINKARGAMSATGRRNGH